MSQREKTLLLLGVILIVCSLALSEWLEPPQLSSPPLHVGKSMNNPPFSSSAFALNLPESKRTMILKNPRNIFAPLKDAHEPEKIHVPPTPKRPPPSPVQPAPSPAPPQPTGPTPAELAARETEQEMQQYKFLGYLTKGGVQQGFLSKGQAIYIVKQGERVEGDLEIKSISPTAVVLSKHVKQAGTTVETTLPLTKEAF